MRNKTPQAPKTLAQLYSDHESFGADAKALYKKKDSTLKKLVTAWRKDKGAVALTQKHKKTGVLTKYALEIEDAFRGQTTKAFAPGFAHRYKLKLKTVPESE